MPKCKQCNVDHMGLCHSCPHNGRVAGPYELSPCASCYAAEARIQGHGRNVSFEEIEPIIATPEQEAPAEDKPMAEWMRLFLGITTVQREIVVYFLRNPEGSLQEAAHYLEHTFNDLRIRAEQRAALARAMKGAPFKDPRFTLQAIHEHIRTLRKMHGSFDRILQRVDVRIGLKAGPEA